MRKTRQLEVGTFVTIPLGDGSFGYGRVLSHPYVAFYNYRTQTESSDLDLIQGKPLLFSQAVRILEHDRWKHIGIRPLDGEATKPVVRFMQDLADFRKCTIFDSDGMEKSVAPEDCVGVERASVWDAHHIEQRMLDYFMARPNEAEMRGRVRLK